MTGPFRDCDWDLETSPGHISWDRVPIAVLMDIRAELRQLNRLLNCPNAVGIPRTLRAIQTNTTNLPKRRKPPATKS
jgi:hypothetical protein